MEQKHLEKVIHDLGIKIANLVIELSIKDIQLNEASERIIELENALSIYNNDNGGEYE